MFILGQDGNNLVNIDNISHLFINNHNVIMAKPVEGLAIKMGEYGSRSEADFIIQDIIGNTTRPGEYYKMPQKRPVNTGCPFDEPV